MKRLFLVFSVVLALSLIIYFNGYCTDSVYTEGESYQIEVLEDGQIQVRKATRVYKDGVEISKTYHRHVLDVEDDLSKEDARVSAIADVVWTPEVIAERIEEKEANKIE